MTALSKNQELGIIIGVSGDGFQLDIDRVVGDVQGELCTGEGGSACSDLVLIKSGGKRFAGLYHLVACAGLNPQEPARGQ